MAIVAFLDLQLHMLSSKEIIPSYSIPVLQVVIPSGNEIVEYISGVEQLCLWEILFMCQVYK